MLLHAYIVQPFFEKNLLTVDTVQKKTFITVFKSSVHIAAASFVCLCLD